MIIPGTYLRSVVIGLMTLALVAVPLYGGSAQRPTAQNGATPGVGPCAQVLRATPEASPVGAGNAADYPFDLVFIDAMVVNHEATVAMADIARQTSERQEILTIAQGMIETEVGNVSQLRAWRTAWYPEAGPVPDNVITGLGDEGLMISGGLGGSGESTLTDDTADAVQRLCVPDGPFDLVFLTEVIPLQQRAVGMARLALDQAEHAELKALAEEIVTVQEEEVSRLIARLAEWYPLASLGDANSQPTS